MGRNLVVESASIKKILSFPHFGEFQMFAIFFPVSHQKLHSWLLRENVDLDQHGMPSFLGHWSLGITTTWKLRCHFRHFNISLWWSMGAVDAQQMDWSSYRHLFCTFIVGLVFFKAYLTNRICAFIIGTSPKTFREKVWFIHEGIAGLVDRYVSEHFWLVCFVFPSFLPTNLVFQFVIII